MKNALKTFIKKNGKFPSNVLIYRDGVGDSQISKFLNRSSVIQSFIWRLLLFCCLLLLSITFLSEIAAYKQSFEELGAKPKLSVVLVQKMVMSIAP
jgi:hypothetical protein